MDRNFALQDTLGTAESDLSAVLSERNKARSDIGALRGQIAKLETRLAGIQDSQLDAVERLTNHTVANIDSIEKVVNLTGLDMDRLLRAGASTPEGQGGAFIEVRPDGAVAGHLKARLTNLEGYLGQWEALQNIMRMLPLTAPLDHYYITSRHGKRRDPINKKWAMHYGLDLGSSFKTSVFATSPGTVTYVGWNGRYGRMVEVDHGAGLKTRYGHLHKILVEKGQKLAYREKVGLLGNTGRSTGAHLHYEVLFNARPHDPSKFIGAGRHVFKE
jgi:murein DD-endopeptidase MepM/ murein hydrolase activator NlpD